MRPLLNISGIRERFRSVLERHPGWRRAGNYLLRHKLLTVAGVFLVWMTFFDRNSLLLHIERERNISALQDSISYYRREIERQKTFLRELESDPKQMEKFVREHYNMKKPDEDIYLIRRTND